MTVTGRTTTSAIVTPSSTSTQKETYRVAAFDSCSNTSPMGNFHTSMFLKVQNDECSGYNILTWNPYIHFSLPLSRYRVLVSVNGRVPFLLATLSSDTTFTHTNTYSDTSYCYFVRAYNQDSSITAMSNRTCITPQVKHVPQFAVINSVSVVSGDQIEVAATLDSESQVGKYLLLRALNSAGPFDTLTILDVPFPSLFTFIDEPLLTSRNDHFYKIIGTDNCGNPLIESNLSKPSRLQGIAQLDLYNRLNWTLYEGWPQVERYELYRWINGAADTIQLAQIPATTSEYVDDVGPLAEGPGTFCYLIKAVKQSSDHVTSNSNSHCVKQVPRLFVPSGFTPDGDGLNDVFDVKNVFSDAKEYHLIIYNKRGQSIFESRSQSIGWDGTYRGDLVMEGAYPYYISIISRSGEEFIKTGSVTVLR
jgi:gliding motility-associated-like protein